jgi:hypothetical protein
VDETSNKHDTAGLHGAGGDAMIRFEQSFDRRDCPSVDAVGSVLS